MSAKVHDPNDFKCDKTIGIAWPLFFILNFQFGICLQCLWGWQWWVWHSSPLLLMALNLTS